MTTKPVSIGSLKKGSYVVIDDAPCKVVDVQVSKPGKHGHAKVRMVGVGIIDDKKREIVAPGHDNIDVPIVEKKNAQILSIRQETVNEKNIKMGNVMDLSNYETFDMEIPDDLADTCVEGTIILYWEIMGNKIMKQMKSEGNEAE